MAQQKGDTAKLSQFESGIEFSPRDPGEKVSFSLEDADLNEVVRVMGELTGKRFILSTAKVKGFKATVVAPQKITVAEAYQAFLSILQTNGLTVIPNGRFLKIVDSQEVTRQTTPINDATGEERYVTRVHRLSHVPVEEVVSTVLSKFQTKDGSIVTYAPGNLLIITDTGANIRRMMRLLEDIDVAGEKDRLYLQPLNYVSAADVEKRLSEIFDLKGGNAGSRELHIAKIVPIERPNALVIVATKQSYDRLLEVLKCIDVPATSDTQFRVVKLQYGDAKKIVPALQELMGGGAPKQGAPGAQPQTILEAPVKVSAEESTNAILITSSPRDFASLFEVIKELDMPRRQVYIEAVVMDLSIEKSKTMGFAFHGGDQTGDGTTILGGNNAASSAIFDAKSLQALALAVRGPSITIPGLPKELGTSLPSFGVFIHAYGLDKDTDILSTPHIIATDNIPAEIKVVLNVATQRNVAPVQVIPGLNQPVSGAAQYQKLGPKIKITPHLNESDEVRLDVVEEISDLTAEPKDGLGTITFLERVATTTLTVKDQQTVVIGGLVRNKVARSESKVPFLGDIPVIGALFRTSSTQNEKSNLVLVLTPHIIRDQDDLRRIHERKMQERQEFIDHQALFGDQDYEIPKDMSRTFGLLEDIRQSYVRVAEQRALDALNAPKLLKEQGPTAPLDLPVAPRPKTSPAAPPVNVAPPSRNLDRVER